MPTVAADELHDLYDRYAGRIYTLAHYTLGSRSAAEDAVQTVFLRASQHLGRFRGDAALGTWLWRIALNHVTDEQRRRKRIEEVPLDAILGWADESASPEARRGVKEIDEIVARALLELPPNFRTVVVLRYIEEMPYDQIAEVLGCSIGTVSSRLARGLAMLEKILRPVVRR